MSVFSWFIYLINASVYIYFPFYITYVCTHFVSIDFLTFFFALQVFLDNVFLNFGSSCKLGVCHSCVSGGQPLTYLLIDITMHGLTIQALLSNTDGAKLNKNGHVRTQLWGFF